MTYLSDREKNKKRNIKLFIFFIFLIVGIFSWQKTQRYLYPYFEPALFVFDNTKSVITFLPKNIVSFFKSKAYYVNHINELEENIERLENTVALYEGELVENSIKIQNHEEEFGAASIVAHPLIHDIGSIYSTVILSKGYRDGVDEGMIVYIRGMQPVGYISKIHDKTSEMFLFSSPKNKLEGVIGDEVILQLVGIGGGNFIANIPRDIDLNIGDSVYYRSNIKMKLGVISDIKNEEQDVFKRVYIRGAYNPIKSNNFFIDR